jgi:transglutaminase-like putative cysteine protease
MKYRINHTTSYQYSSPVSVCHNILMLSPRNTDRLSVQSHKILIKPPTSKPFLRMDAFGNHVYSFSIEENHRQLTISAISRVTVAPTVLCEPDKTVPWEIVLDELKSQTNPQWLENVRFCYESPRIYIDPVYKVYAETSFMPQRPILSTVIDLNRRIKKDFEYNTTATTVNTTTLEAFKLRKGVCQDFSHIMISCLRTMGFPARYVSGYLCTQPPPGKKKLVGADQSHAWVSVYCGMNLGWVDIDPTNDCLCSTSHIPIAWGRDYSDIVPIRGTFIGGGNHSLDVAVDVIPIE